MTAEIAILNKTAVALATDSAVTISTGETEDKIFDSADKLFELSLHNPIGIMIYNGMSFMEAPLPSLIKSFRSQCASCDTVQEAADHFLRYLNNFAKRSPKSVQHRSMQRVLSSMVSLITERYQHKLFDIISDKKLKPSESAERLKNALDEVIATVEKAYSSRKDAEFIGGIPNFKGLTKLIDDVLSHIKAADAKQKARLRKLAIQCLRKSFSYGNHTGIVIAGFGSGELFPTLIAFEIDGAVQGRLKFVRKQHVDIDRDGPRARVIPFAQREMVERFLYGLDEKIQRLITKFVSSSAAEFRKSVEARVLGDRKDEQLQKDLALAEDALIDGLRKRGFEAIQTQSQEEIEDMVEFMPKPELAKMAEALVNLTSIKKRVSRGMETVGGPIDVAVISQSEGFIWVKRKHYFPPELNVRYAMRINGRDSKDGDPNG